jgi:hypothetical protein
MPKNAQPKKIGRPRKQIDRSQFEKLCMMFATRDEICSWFDTTSKTLDRWCKDEYGEPFSTVYKQKREGGKISLRRQQLQLASKSAAMAIFLGKQYLGQTDQGERNSVEEQAKPDALSEALESLAGELNELQ